MVDFFAKIGLDKLERALIYGLAIAVVLAFFTNTVAIDAAWIGFFFRWLHVISGVMWIGLLWYFNFVQIPSMPKIPDDQKPAIGKVIAPAALFWFRWAALATVITGLLVALSNHYLYEALTLSVAGRPKLIGIGMWIGMIMAYNVWMIIWPNQKIALGMVEADADAKKKAARTAMITSRINTMLSIPLLYFMVGAKDLVSG